MASTYTWDAKSKEFTRHVIDRGQAGTGLQIRTADLDADGKPEVIVAGKSGTFIAWNRGK